jgi:GntR family transcriptional regulator
VSTQQGTGTFISDKQIKLTEVEREGMLDTLVRPLISKAASYGFTMTEVLDAVRDAYKGIVQNEEEDHAIL